ncbi:hypothetical protein JBE27_24650 [Streptomyces albiflaviniger]|nr:hypothetical protein [Streptomyces albiflaviniger]
MTATRTARWFDRYREPPETGVAPGRIAEIVVEEMRGLRPLPAYPVALQPLLLPVAEFRELLRAATDLLALIRRAVLHAGPDRAGRIAALGIDPADVPLFTADEDFELRHCADMGRADVVIGPDGPRFVEFNVSGAFGGMPDCHAHQQAWRRITALAGRPAYLGVDPWAHLAALVERTCAEFGVPPGIVVVDDVGDGTVLATGRSVQMWLDGLRTHGIEARHVQVADLLDTLGHPGTLRYPVGLCGFDLDDMRTVGHDIGPARRALDAGFRMIPSQTSWLLHTKKVLARLSEGAPWMGAADRDLVARYVPWSRVVGDRPVTWRGRRYELPQLLIEHRESFVLKGATGCSAQEVSFGSWTEPADWARLVDEGVRTGYPVAQEIVRSAPYPVDLLAETGEITRVAANAVVSPFVLGGVGAGCTARFDWAERPGVVLCANGAVETCLLAEL